MNEEKTTLRVLALSGSLRAASSNTTLLRAAAQLAPPNISVEIYQEIGALPHFNFDLDSENAPLEVLDFRRHLRESDAVLICSPEYAHGVPGSFKNALDWLVRSGELMDKPVALLNASPSSFHAHESLRETLSVMMARVTSTRVPLAGNKITEAEIVSNHEISTILRQILASLSEAATSRAN